MGSINALEWGKQRARVNRALGLDARLDKRS